MAKTQSAEIPLTKFEVTKLSHDGRGISRESDGKVAFIDNALAGETVYARKFRAKRKLTEFQAKEIEQPSSDRQTPPCPYTHRCGGCNLQHMQTDKQIEHKESVLKELLSQINITPSQWLPSLQCQTQGYRTKTRLGVKYMAGKEICLVGFREMYAPYLVDMEHCKILTPELSALIEPLRHALAELEIRSKIPQVELAQGEDGIALVLRHLVRLGDEDRQKLIAFGQAHNIQMLGQSKGPNTVKPIDESQVLRPLHYRHEDYDLTMSFDPLDFTQVNQSLNRAMLKRAMTMLALNKNDKVLDLFCGIGNFSLPLATQAGHVMGVELERQMVEKAKANAQANGLDNCQFLAGNLFEDIAKQAWVNIDANKVLMDPPRSGAKEVCQWYATDAKFKPKTILYISCNPATFARDAQTLVQEAGYALEQCGAMDMFPHTSHVETIGLFQLLE